MNDEDYIDIAIEISKNAKYPYGAIVVKDGDIIGRSDDKTLTPTSMYSHAELEAIESASKNKNLYGDLKGAIMFVSCEPCTSSAYIVSDSRISWGNKKYFDFGKKSICIKKNVQRYLDMLKMFYFPQ